MGEITAPCKDINEYGFLPTMGTAALHGSRRPGYGVDHPLSPSKGKRKVKGKGHPITGHEGPEGEKMYCSTLPSTLALDGGWWSTPRPGRFTPGKDAVPIV